MAIAYSVTIIIAFLALNTNGQECNTYQSREYRGEFDIECRCMQSLSQLPERINILSVNQDGCDNKYLEVDWKQLQSQLSVRTVIFENASLKFKIAGPNIQTPTASVEELILSKCDIKDFETNTFLGLNKLEKIGIYDSRITRIATHAFFKIPNLKTIEIAKTNINIVFEKGFNLDNDHLEMFITDSFIEVLYYDSIKLKSRARVCPRGRSDIMLQSVLAQGRSLQENFNLPEGSKLFIFRSKMTLLMHDAFNTEGIGFILVVGTKINVLEDFGFSLNLRNGCPITSFMLLGSTIDRVAPRAFAGIRGSTYAGDGRSYLAFAKNNFTNFGPGSFVINETLNVFSVDSNYLNCSGCNVFNWDSTNSAAADLAPSKFELEKQLLTNSHCFSGLSLPRYLNEKCDVDIQVPVTPPKPVVVVEENIPYNHEEHKMGNPGKKDQENGKPGKEYEVYKPGKEFDISKDEKETGKPGKKEAHLSSCSMIGSNVYIIIFTIVIWTF